MTKTSVGFFWLGIRPAAAILFGLIILGLVFELVLSWISQRSGISLSGLDQRASSSLISYGVSLLVSPWLMLGVTLIGIKSYSGDVPITSLVRSFGFQNRPHDSTMVATFVTAVLFVQLFTRVLIPWWSPDFLIPNPVDQINALPLWFKLAIALTMITIVPVSEELLFRGVLYSCFAAAWNELSGVLIPSLVFILMHPHNLASGNAVTHFAFYGFTILMAISRVISRGLYLPIMLHAGFNFSGLFF